VARHAGERELCVEGVLRARHVEDAALGEAGDLAAIAGEGAFVLEIAAAVEREGEGVEGFEEVGVLVGIRQVEGRADAEGEECALVDVLEAGVVGLGAVEGVEQEVEVVVAIGGVVAGGVALSVVLTRPEPEPAPYQTGNTGWLVQPSAIRF